LIVAVLLVDKDQGIAQFRLEIPESRINYGFAIGTKNESRSSFESHFERRLLKFRVRQNEKIDCYRIVVDIAKP